MTDLVHLLSIAASALAALLVASVISRFALWGLDKLAWHKEAQRKCFEVFYDGLARVMKETSDEKQFEMRRALITLAEMLARDKGGFAKYYFLKNRNREPERPSKAVLVVQKQMADLPHDVKGRLSDTLGHGLLASTYDLPFTGWLLRSGMKVDSVTKTDTVVHEPQNVVARASAMKVAYKGHDHHDDMMAPA